MFTTLLSQTLDAVLLFMLTLADRLTVDFPLFLAAALVAKIAHRHMWLIYIAFAALTLLGAHR